MCTRTQYPDNVQIRDMSEDRDAPFESEDIAFMRNLANQPSDVDPTLWSLASETFNVDPAFLYSERNVVFDPSTKAPVPQRLAFRQQARTRKGEATLTLIQRFVASDEHDPRKTLQEAFKEAPVLDAKSFEELHDELKAAQDAFTRKSPPDYERAALMEKAAGIATAMAAGESRGASRHFMFWTAMQIQNRREHRRYLERLKVSLKERLLNCQDVAG
eukprot:Blabericola_migrator_1__1583@NODE_141_length_13107_cov_85_385736_g123_i0_p6_GENE_NODE_141_length_13107_cov_85_385736_g123_i0NODE_141_length_13107_cov_85_385736_g123_i0_p6_ORF_typecomplete_len217_score39_71DUF2075/PF09848_9/0_12Thioredoxin_4/PF13462_6/0_29_NODE_141_length_13107_cov_85_385736_g123_i01062111271